MYNSYLVVKPNESLNETVGIIDGYVSITYDNVILSDSSKSMVNFKTHGDELITFLQKYCSNIKIYYFNATNEKGIVNTKTLIEGLNWMKENNISKVNISMSSKVYSKELEDWIDSNKDIVQVYASYNNLTNSRDYPAMYKNVISSGISKNINFKDIDVKYRNNNIIVSSEPFKVYKGNSYLSLLTMINN